MDNFVKNHVVLAYFGAPRVSGSLTINCPNYLGIIWYLVSYRPNNCDFDYHENGIDDSDKSNSSTIKGRLTICKYEKDLAVGVQILGWVFINSKILFNSF